uniref:RING-type E3 ubiquitin transferase n=1 Tax=Heterorhabditis bacteriophora TaxID=37862 RepID=A0A1I7WIR5_HETBA
MDPLPSAHPMSVLQPMSASRTPTAAQQQIGFTTAPTGQPLTANPYIPLELMMYHQTGGLVLPQAHPVAPCLLTTQSLMCQSCIYSSPSQPCSIHPAPIAYGQATSSFAAPVTQQHTGQQQIINEPPQASLTSQAHTVALPNAILHQQQQRRDVEIARQHTSLPPTLPTQMRSMAMRLKRGPSIATRVQSALEATVRAPKLRRVASDGSREIQVTFLFSTVQPDPIPQQDQPPSTSQLVSGSAATGVVPITMPSSCVNCGPNGQRGCPACTPCFCALCPHAATGAGVNTTSHLAAPLAMPPQTPQFQQVNQQAQAMANAGFRYVQDAIFASTMLETMQRQQQQQHLQNQLQFSQYGRILPSSTGLFVLPRPTGGYPVTANGRMIELNMLVNVVPSELLGMVDRPVLERHHMFAAPVSEPMPIGASPQDIEKCTEKIQFIKDGEVPENETERCTVCLCDFETGEEVRNLRCTHIFHVNCIDKWLVYNKKCPVCRLDVDKQKTVLVDLQIGKSCTVFHLVRSILTHIVIEDVCSFPSAFRQIYAYGSLNGYVAPPLCIHCASVIGIIIII